MKWVERLMPVFAQGIGDITDGGERVTHLHPNDCYFAHLALYAFARPYCQEADVLDAGSGAGYGAAYLARNGARSVLGLDVSLRAVAFSRRHFQAPNLHFEVMDLETITGLAPHSFDLIFASNVLEHLADVTIFLRTAHQLLRPQGRAIFAVPPITSPELRAADLTNPYHLNSWSPRQWEFVFGQYFCAVQPYAQRCSRPSYQLDFTNAPQATRITEQDFAFEPVDSDGLGESLGAVFLVERPRLGDELPAREAPPHFIDDSFSRPAPPRPQHAISWAQMGGAAWRVLRRHGPQAFVQEALRHLRRWL